MVLHTSAGECPPISVVLYYWPQVYFRFQLLNNRPLAFAINATGPHFGKTLSKEKGLIEALH